MSSLSIVKQTKNQTKKNTLTYKIVLVGDAGTGKSTFVKRLSGLNFVTSYHATLGVDVHCVTFKSIDNNYINFCIWDTAGQEKFGGIREGYYRNTDGVIILCDNNKMTQKNVAKWKTHIKQFCPSVPIMTIKNKIDVASKSNNKQNEIMTFDFEMSTKNMTDYDDILEELYGLVKK